MPVYKVVSSEQDGTVCVKSVSDDEKYVDAVQYVEVTLNENNVVTSVEKKRKGDENTLIPGEAKPKPVIAEQQDGEVAEQLNQQGQVNPGEQKGGFSMKSLSRGLFGSKKSKRRFSKRSFKKSKRSGRKHRSTRRR
jgi:hypothetical protein